MDKSSCSRRLFFGVAPPAGAAAGVIDVSKSEDSGSSSTSTSKKHIDHLRKNTCE